MLPFPFSFWKSAGGGGGGGYLISDNFEYANNAAAASAGWNNTGTPQWGYNTAPAPLVGSFSLALTSSANYVDRSFTATANVWAFIAVNTGVTIFDIYPLIFRDGTNANVGYVEFTSLGAIQIFEGTGNVSSANGVIVTGTTYYVWLHRITGTGANGFLEVFVSTTTTKPGAATLTITNGSTVNNAQNIQIYNNTAFVMIADYLRVSATVIGSAPA